MPASEPRYEGSVLAVQFRRANAISRAVVRLHVATGHDALDAQLAAGASRLSRPELALRAAQLERPQQRRALARTLRLVVSEARGARPPLCASPVVVAPEGVRAHARELLALADRLEAPGPARARGVAIVRQLITDVQSSPLYAPDQAHRLGHVIALAMTHLGERRRPRARHRARYSGPASERPCSRASLIASSSDSRSA
jgi:hypothetical protein